MKTMTKCRQQWILMAMVCLMTFSAVSTAGCAGKSKTTSSTTTTSGDSGSTTSVTTQQQTTETSAHPRGVIGGLFYTIGQIIVWPFKVIGSLF